MRPAAHRPGSERGQLPAEDPLPEDGQLEEAHREALGDGRDGRGHLEEERLSRRGRRRFQSRVSQHGKGSLGKIGS